MIAAPERRRHDRQECRIPLTGRNGRHSAAVTAVDLSPTGARVIIPADWQGRWLTLSGEGIRKASTVRCQIVWKRTTDEGETLAGIHFLEDPSRLGASWVQRNLRTPRRHQSWSVPCDREITVALAGSRHTLEASLKSLSPAGAELEGVPYWPIGTLLRLDLPFRVQARVIGHARKSTGWRLSVQLLLPEDASAQRQLQTLLKDLKPAR